MKVYDLLLFQALSKCKEAKKFASFSTKTKKRNEIQAVIKKITKILDD